MTQKDLKRTKNICTWKSCTFKFSAPEHGVQQRPGIGYIISVDHRCSPLRMLLIYVYEILFRKINSKENAYASYNKENGHVMDMQRFIN